MRTWMIARFIVWPVIGYGAAAFNHHDQHTCIAAVVLSLIYTTVNSWIGNPVVFFLSYGLSLVTWNSIRGMIWRNEWLDWRGAGVIIFWQVVMIIIIWAVVALSQKAPIRRYYSQD